MNQLLVNNELPISRYLTIKAGKQGIPITGGFELTSRCNFNCKMCYVHSQDDPEHLKKQELSVEQWIKIAEEAKEQGLIFLLLTGGEAMLRNDFVELYSQLAVMGFRIAINSNGSLISDEVLSCFRKYPPSRVNISLYGASNETYEALCENRAFDKVKSAVHLLKNEGISVRVTMMLTNYNVGDMEKVYKIAKEEDVLCEMTSYMFPQTRVTGCCGENKARLSSEEAGIYMARRDRMLMGDKAFQQYIKNIDKMVPVKVKEDVKEGKPITCQAGRCSFWITWNGMMKPCGLMFENEVDVLKEGFKSAWDKIHRMSLGIRLPKECVNCNNKDFCQQCVSVCQAETGRFDSKPTYMCELVEAKLKEYERLKKK